MTTVFAVGDVFPAVPGGRDAFRALTPVLQTADIVFGNCEGVYSDRPAPSPSRKHFMGAARAHGSFLADVPFHVMTLANNHMVDGGYVGLNDTIELLRSQGIATTGAGDEIDEAITPAVIGNVAFLGFCSVYPVGYEARHDRPGLAPLRVRTHYDDPDPNFWEPGIAPLISTEPHAQDLDRFRDAIGRARERADRVIVACHWGYSSLLEELHDYELRLARDAVDHGADAVVCHHHHSLRGIELHDGRPIFYGLGALVHHFVDWETSRESRAARERRFGALSSQKADDIYPLWPFSAESRRTGIATLELRGDGEPPRAGLIPALILEDGSTEPLATADPRAEEIARYVEDLSARAGFDTRFERGDRGGYLELTPQ
jgi:poly-gamma-glutamate synthesis protein (capsule biosynthesis protein)